MMYVVPFHTDHLYDLMKNAEEFGTNYDQAKFIDFTTKTQNYWTAYTGYQDDQVIGVGGLVEIYPHLAEAWIVLLRNQEYSPLAYTRKIIKMWNKILSDHPRFERIQATVNEDFEQGIRFLDYLGFENEGLMKKFGPDKSNFYRYAYIRHGPN